MQAKPLINPAKPFLIKEKDSSGMAKGMRSMEESILIGEKHIKTIVVEKEVSANYELEIRNYDFSIFSNPNNGNFDLQLTTYDLRLNNAEVRIYNVLGEIVYQQTLNSKHETLNTKLTKGVYLLQLQSEQGIVSQKIVVQ